MYVVCAWCGVCVGVCVRGVCVRAWCVRGVCVGVVCVWCDVCVVCVCVCVCGVCVCGVCVCVCVCVCVSSHGTTRLPLDGFSRNLIFDCFCFSFENLSRKLKSR